MKREAKFTTRLKKWLRANDMLGTAAMEIKITTNKSIPFNAVKDHQLDALSASKHGAFSYKLPDAGWQNPFDLVTLSNIPAYVVLAFEFAEPPRTKIAFYFVDIDTFLNLRDVSERESVTEDMLEGVGVARHVM